MNRFAELLDRLAYEPGRNNKLRLLTSYFRETEDPDRGYALAALTGALSFKHAKPALVRDLITERTDPVLFALSYDYVGDLSETVALMWPKVASQPPSAVGDLWSRRFPDPVSAFASGWMRVRARARQGGIELPLVISDHADWDGLCATIEATGAGEIWVTHGQEDALVHWCTTKGLRARPLDLLGYGDEDEGAPAAGTDIRAGDA